MRNSSPYQRKIKAVVTFVYRIAKYWLMWGGAILLCPVAGAFYYTWKWGGYLCGGILMESFDAWYDMKTAFDSDL